MLRNAQSGSISCTTTHPPWSSLILRLCAGCVPSIPLQTELPSPQPPMFDEIAPGAGDHPSPTVPAGGNQNDRQWCCTCPRTDSPDGLSSPRSRCNSTRLSSTRLKITTCLVLPLAGAKRHTNQGIDTENLTVPDGGQTGIPGDEHPRDRYTYRNPIILHVLEILRDELGLQAEQLMGHLRSHTCATHHPLAEVDRRMHPDPTHESRHCRRLK
jgi:hypothetical protein